MPLVKRGNSKFWYVQFQIDHRTFIRSTRTTDRKVAEKLEAQFRAEAHAEGVMGRKKPISLEQAISRFIASKSGTPNHKNLVSRKAVVLRILPGAKPIASLRSDDLEHFKRTRVGQGCSPQTIKHGLNLILGAIRFASRSGYDAPVLHPPMIKIGNGKLRYLTLEEERRLLNELDPHRDAVGFAAFPERDAVLQREMQDNFDLVVLLLDTGARYSEIARLTWDQIDLERKTIALWRSKVDNESTLFMTNRVAEIFANRGARRTCEFVFFNSRGNVRGYTVVSIRKAFRRAGLHDCTVHTLRHTHASRLIQHGMTVYEVRAILGHSDIRTTMRYAHLEQTTVTSKARDVMDRFNEDRLP